MLSFLLSVISSAVRSRGSPRRSKRSSELNVISGPRISSSSARHSRLVSRHHLPGMNLIDRIFDYSLKSPSLTILFLSWRRMKRSKNRFVKRRSLTQFPRVRGPLDKQIIRLRLRVPRPSNRSLQLRRRPTPNPRNQLNPLPRSHSLNPTFRSSGRICSSRPFLPSRGNLRTPHLRTETPRLRSTD